MQLIDGLLSLFGLERRTSLTKAIGEPRPGVGKLTFAEVTPDQTDDPTLENARRSWIEAYGLPKQEKKSA